MQFAIKVAPPPLPLLTTIRLSELGEQETTLLSFAF
jgi:hypothetical protein